MSAPHSSDIPRDRLPVTLADLDAEPRTAILLPEEVTYDAIQAALTAAEGSDKTVVVGGEITTDQTLTITSDCDLSRLTINYTGTTVAVQVGTGTPGSYISRKTVRLGYVKCKSKPSPGWLPGTVGLRVVNANTCEVHAIQVSGFEINLSEEGLARGHSYNRFHGIHLDNGKINQRLYGDATGWCNENNYYGMRYSHYTSEGRPAAGTRHILTDSDAEAGVGSVPNNNRWWGPSMESPGVVEFTVDINRGVFNSIYHARYEYSGGRPSVRWGENALWNTLDGGYDLTGIRETFVSGQIGNQILSPQYSRRIVVGTSGDTLESSSGVNSPVLTVMRSGGRRAGDDPTTQYAWRASQTSLGGKPYSNTYDRLRMDFSTGALRFGVGYQEPTVFLQGETLGLELNGGHLIFKDDGTLDVGGYQARPRDVHVVRHIRLGSLYLRDNEGVLESSPDGTAWTPVVLGDDAQLSDERDPTAHQHPLTDLPEVEAALDGKEKKPWQGTQAQYDALGSYESDRTYYITD